MTETFCSPTMTPDYVQKTYQGLTAFIEIKNGHAIYYHEDTKSFRVHIPGVFEYTDEKQANKDYEDLHEAILYAWNLERKRGHGAVVASRIETIVRKFATSAPAIPADLSDPWLNLKGQKEDMQYAGPWVVSKIKEKIWIYGPTALSATDFQWDLAELKKAFEIAKKMGTAGLEPATSTL